MTHPTRFPLEAFPAEYRVLLMRGTKESVEVKCASIKAARNLQRQLHIFRNKCQRASVPGWEMLYRTMTRTDKKKPGVLIVEPRGSEFLDALAAFKPTDDDLRVADDPLADVEGA